MQLNPIADIYYMNIKMLVLMRKMHMEKSNREPVLPASEVSRMFEIWMRIFDEQLKDSLDSIFTHTKIKLF
jgi:hypothetical protein